jgi:hypothetical protein
MERSDAAALEVRGASSMSAGLRDVDYFCGVTEPW